MMFGWPMGRPRGACPPAGLAAWPARLASMTHLSANSRAFCLPGCYSLPYPEPKGASGAILGRLSSAMDFFSGV
jgi:hypothetical protein